MATKIYKTKTFWVGLAAIATGVGMIVAGDVQTGIQTILGGLAAITGRQAIDKMSGGKEL